MSAKIKAGRFEKIVNTIEGTIGYREGRWFSLRAYGIAHYIIVRRL